MAYREVTQVSWFSRIGKSIVGALIGLVMAVVAVPLLFWNEGRAVQTARSLEEGAGAVVTVPVDRVDPANEGKLIHVTGTSATTETLSDSQFGVSANAIRLERNVEMYQWDERKKTKSRKKLGGGEEQVTTYEYDKKWSSRLIDSSEFKEGGHQNPNRMPYESKSWHANEVTVGGFRLSAEQIRELDDSETLSVQGLAAPKDARLRNEGDALFLGEASSSPQIGDVRIGFEVVKPGPVSLVGVQTGDTFAAYQTHAGDTLLLVEQGTMTAAQMFSAAQDRNTALTWALRFAGWLLMFIGLGLIAKPLSVLGDVVPFIGTVIGIGTGFLAFFAASAVSAITVAVAWVAYRPLVGIGLLAVAGLAVFFLVKRARAKKQLAQPVAMRPAA